MSAILEVTCAQCGTVFSRSRSRIKVSEGRGYEQYCSRQCGSVGKRLDPKAPKAGHIAVRLNGEQREFIISSAERDGVPYGEFIRRCIDAQRAISQTARAA